MTMYTRRECLEQSYVVRLKCSDAIDRGEFRIIIAWQCRYSIFRQSLCTPRYRLVSIMFIYTEISMIDQCNMTIDQYIITIIPSSGHWEWHVLHIDYYHSSTHMFCRDCIKLKPLTNICRRSLSLSRTDDSVIKFSMKIGWMMLFGIVILFFI